MKLCLLKMKFVAISAFYLFNVIMAESDSPCPHIFIYRTDGAGPLYGVISTTAPSDFQGLMNLEIQISVGNLIGDMRGNIDLITPNSQVMETIQQNRPLLFKVNMPYWIYIKPKITKISVNENLICVGEPIHADLVRETTGKLTTVTLKFKLQISNFASGPVIQHRPQNTFFNKPSNIHPPAVDTFQQGNTISPQIPIQTPSTFVGSNDLNSYFTTASTQRVPIQKPTAPIPRPTTAIASSSSISSSISSICGRRRTTTVQLSAVIPLILGGEDAPEGANPWLAALFKLKDGRPQFICGSTIISTKHVVTAGHCVSGVADIKRFHLALGTNDIYNWAEFTKRSLVNIHIHPDYALNSGDADVAVLVMSEEVQFSATIAPACLWNNNVNNFQDTVGTSGLVAGWGIDESGSVAAKPKQISMPIVSEEICLRSATEFLDVTSNRTFCAGSRDNSGPCNGDSGGGFYVQMNDVWYIRGIVSHSLSTRNRTCDLSNYLVFTDIAQHVQWITTKVTY